MSDNDLDLVRVVVDELLMPLLLLLLPCSFVPKPPSVAVAAAVAAVELGRSDGKGILRLGDDTPPGPLIPPPFNNDEPGGGIADLLLVEFEIGGGGGNGGNDDDDEL